MKLSHAHPGWAGHGGEVWQNVVYWRREWKTTSVFLPWEPHEQYEKANERILKEELTRSVGTKYATRDQWRNNSRKNEGEQKWTGMGEFNSDDHYIYYCRQESLRRNGVAIMINERVWNTVLRCNLKNDRMISVRFQWKLFNFTVIQVYAPTSNANEAEVERFYEDLQDLLEVTPQKDVLFIIGDWNAKVGSQETPGVTGMKSLSRVRLFATPWTVAYQAPPSMGFSRQEFWSGVPLPSPDTFTRCT